jgi:hypothetical protein
MGYDYDELYPNRFLKSGLFKGKDATLTITSVALEELKDKRGQKTKVVVTFKETKKAMVLNKTNGECVKGMFGRKTDGWIGKRVTFYPANIQAFGKQDTGIRVRGSPDIAGDMNITCRIGTDDVPATMKRTGAAKPGGHQAKPPPKLAPAPEPPPVPEGFDSQTGSAPISDEEAEAILASERAQSDDTVPFG